MHLKREIELHNKYYLDEKELIRKKTLFLILVKNTYRLNLKTLD